MDDVIVIGGGCLCGEVRFTVNKPATAHSMICHCETCRRNASSPVVPWVTFRLEDLSFEQGQPKAYKSSAFVTRTFCSSCGTPLTYSHSSRPAEVDVTTCSLDDPEMFPPTHHSWLEDDLSWIHFGDELPKYQRTSVETGD